MRKPQLSRPSSQSAPSAETFALEGSDYIELKNLLKAANLCDTGSDAKIAISEGLVQVDGVVETRKACKIRTGQVVVFNNKKITVRD